MQRPRVFFIQLGEIKELPSAPFFVYSFHVMLFQLGGMSIKIFLKKKGKKKEEDVNVWIYIR